jgi:hypothetical protein
VYTKHIDQQIEAYLDGQLSPHFQRQVEAHIRECPYCAQRLFDARRLSRELGPVLQASLGQPVPSPMLRHKVRDALEKKRSSQQTSFSWSRPVQIFGAVGNVVLVALLAVGVFVVIRGQLFWSPSVFETMTLGPAEDSQAVAVQPKATATSLPQATTGMGQFRESMSRFSLSDTIIVIPTQIKPKSDFEHPTPLVLKETHQPKITFPPAPAAVETNPVLEPTAVAKRPLPGGTIAYALYNSTPGIQAYETHFISPNGSNYRRYPLRDVSEPALHPTENDFALAVRTWEEKSHPRRIMSSDLEATKQGIVAKFWEDSQPDWSPIENRIIFASQRESDRRWRLYSAWGDGSLEENLQREGKTPTFAPDGRRFAFQGCDNTGNKCGLWSGHLYNNEYGFRLLLENRTATAPDWSPNSDKIAYMAKFADSWNLYLVNSDGSNNRLLTDGAANDGLPAWSPDGEWLAFVSDRGGNWGLWIIHVQSKELHQVTGFGSGSLTAPSRLPYNQHQEHHWWDEQISWGP